MIEQLSTGACHLWVARAPEVLAPEVVDRFEPWLSQDEWTRYQSFRFERHRHLFLLTRGVVRQTLSRYANVAPEDWRFAVGSHGKPHIARPCVAPPLAFNLSNTEGMVACAVTRGAAVGVDVEHTGRIGDPMHIADNFFSARELRDLHALPPSRQRERFFAYWTLKEAYIKARGLGLALPLDQFSFLLREDDRHVALEIDPRLGDEARSWQCARMPIEPPYALAIVLRRRGREDLAVRVRDFDATCGRAEVALPQVNE
jgi:4'-phosphopantetheinyl transferase